MTGFWLASYLVLWGLVVILCLLMVGILRQVGMLYAQHGRRTAEQEATVPTVENDGPTIGSGIPELVAESVNGHGLVTLANSNDGGGTLVMFMSPLCEGCQHIVEPLNALVEDRARRVRPIVIMRADQHACRAFISVFPLRMPMVCDEQRTITMSFGVHGAPFGLLYDEHGVLMRKALVTDSEDLRALLGDTSASDRAGEHVFPRLTAREVLA